MVATCMEDQLKKPLQKCRVTTKCFCATRSYQRMKEKFCNFWGNMFLFSTPFLSYSSFSRYSWSYHCRDEWRNEPLITNTHVLSLIERNILYVTQEGRFTPVNKLIEAVWESLKLTVNYNYWLWAWRNRINTALFEPNLLYQKIKIINLKTKLI